MGKLEGISLTPDIRSILDTALALPQPDRETSTSIAHDNDEHAPKPSTSTSSLSSSPRSVSASSPSALLARVQEAKRDLSRTSITANKAKSLLETTITAIKSDKSSVSGGAVLPLEGVQAIKILINNSQSDPDTREQLLQRLESALRQTGLSFSPNQKKSDNPELEKRLKRLRLQDEERSYMNLTTNLKNASSLKDDNITAKSMMYATSVGLNMVVAPVSFGVFMYFFAGSIFSRFFDSDEEDGHRRPGDVDIRRVIAGVVSGVFMLFVEMILFVIRSHELDASVRKKSRRKENRANPFGYTKKNMERVYVRED